MSEVTASAIVDFAVKLEENASKFYKELAERFPDKKLSLQSFAKTCDRNRISILRTYQETITDAIEAGYSVKEVNLNDYAVDFSLPANISLADALKKAVDFEEKVASLFSTVAEQSKDLLHTIADAFRIAARKHRDQKQKVEALIGK
ncbi:MAG: hypothetical protein J7L98_01555 [Candidatus Verstraetearchaeota archaeon]|nr:hypothetical protein [Candidatus Verstraetearchaeota archaeon]